MDFEEYERRQRRQKLNVFIAETGMFLSVIAIVVVALLSAMGFFVSSDGSIEQMGLAQIHSTPTGGTVEIDGGVLFSRTNLSRSLPAGEHQVKIWRDNYDTWERTVKMYPGVLVRLYYPRIFLKNRTQELAKTLGAELEFYAPSTDGTYILYAEKDSTSWQLVNLKGDELQTAALDLQTILPGVNGQNFLGKIEQLDWNEDSSAVLVKVSYAEGSEWILVNLRDIKQSLNLTRTFGMNFTQVAMIDDAASQLYALENQHLRKINIGSQAVSRVLLSDVREFANENANVIYTTDKVVGVYRDNEKGGTVIAHLQDGEQAKVALAKYYDAEYMAFVVNRKMTIYYGALPPYREDANETDFSALKTLMEKIEIAEQPKKITVSLDGEYLVAQNGAHYTVIDLDMGDVFEYGAPVESLHWIADGMMTATTEQHLEVWDFDHTNRRVLVQDVRDQKDTETQLAEITTATEKPLANYPATITSNDKWLYYVVRDHGNLKLAREKIRE